MVDRARARRARSERKGGKKSRRERVFRGAGAHEKWGTAIPRSNVAQGKGVLETRT